MFKYDINNKIIVKTTYYNKPQVFVNKLVSNPTMAKRLNIRPRIPHT